MFNLNQPPKIENEIKTPQDIFDDAKEESLAIEINEKDRNSEGKLLVFPGGPESNLSEENWKLVRSPSFKKWFGESNIVDENGEPALLFHKTEDDVESFNKFSKEEKVKSKFDPAHYFSGGKHYEFGRNKLSVFINAKVKKVEKFTEIYRFTEEQEREIKTEGYTGVVYDLESAKNELDEMKKKFRQEHAPKEMRDYIFYGLTKIKNILLDSNPDSKEDLRRIKNKMRFIRTLENPMYQLAVFDSDNIMIVKKEKNYSNYKLIK